MEIQKEVKVKFTIKVDKKGKKDVYLQIRKKGAKHFQKHNLETDKTYNNNQEFKVEIEVFQKEEYQYYYSTEENKKIEQENNYRLFKYEIGQENKIDQWNKVWIGYRFNSEKEFLEQNRIFVLENQKNKIEMLKNEDNSYFELYECIQNDKISDLKRAFEFQNQPRNQTSQSIFQALPQFGGLIEKKCNQIIFVYSKQEILYYIASQTPQFLQFQISYGAIDKFTQEKQSSKKMILELNEQLEQKKLEIHSRDQTIKFNENNLKLLKTEIQNLFKYFQEKDQQDLFRKQQRKKLAPIPIQLLTQNQTQIGEQCQNSLNALNHKIQEYLDKEDLKENQLLSHLENTQKELQEEKAKKDQLQSEVVYFQTQIKKLKDSLEKEKTKNKSEIKSQLDKIEELSNQLKDSNVLEKWQKEKIEQLLNIINKLKYEGKQKTKQNEQLNDQNQVQSELINNLKECEHFFKQKENEIAEQTKLIKNFQDQLVDKNNQIQVLMQQEAQQQKKEIEKMNKIQELVEKVSASDQQNLQMNQQNEIQDIEVDTQEFFQLLSQEEKVNHLQYKNQLLIQMNKQKNKTIQILQKSYDLFLQQILS